MEIFPFIIVIFSFGIFPIFATCLLTITYIYSTVSVHFPLIFFIQQQPVHVQQYKGGQLVSVLFYRMKSQERRYSSIFISRPAKKTSTVPTFLDTHCLRNMY